MGWLVRWIRLVGLGNEYWDGILHPLKYCALKIKRILSTPLKIGFYFQMKQSARASKKKYKSKKKFRQKVVL